jgi:hypothetical protein
MLLATVEIPKSGTTKLPGDSEYLGSLGNLVVPGLGIYTVANKREIRGSREENGAHLTNMLLKPPLLKASLMFM